MPSLSYMDGAAIFMALARGMGQHVWMPPCGVAHIHHERTHTGVKQVLAYEDYRSQLPRLFELGDGLNVRHGDNLPSLPFFQYNTDDWGLPNAELERSTLFACPVEQLPHS